MPTGKVRRFQTKCVKVFLYIFNAVQMFFTVLTILMLTELAVGVIMVANRQVLNGTIKTRLSTMIEDYDDTENLAFNRLIDWLQNHFKCCGVDGSDDWIDVPPNSCYCFYCDDRLTIDVYTKGCLETLSGKARLFIIILYTMILVIGLFQLLGLMYSMKLIRHVRKQRLLRDLRSVYSSHPEMLINNNAKPMTTSL
ncbi:CD151 antigen-like isoform X2 [Ptychodera flava]|uniref:CD151 antigen-like isoform X2 n=1 Tax=Ptychodera flava TaxID=63121 RepID=UPI00396A5278